MNSSASAKIFSCQLLRVYWLASTIRVMDKKHKTMSLVYHCLRFYRKFFICAIISVQLLLFSYMVWCLHCLLKQFKFGQSELVFWHALLKWDFQLSAAFMSSVRLIFLAALGMTRPGACWWKISTGGYSILGASMLIQLWSGWSQTFDCWQALCTL